MDKNYVIQLSVVGIIVLLAIIWIIIRVIKKNPAKESGCGGCALVENCKKTELINGPRKDPEEHRALQAGRNSQCSARQCKQQEQSRR